jgi:cytochrome oxidase assembly protein ShyY1
VKRVPTIPTIIVGLAVATMVGLGIWQLRRAEWKEELVAQYEAAQKLPPIIFPTAPLKERPPLFRWATGFCVKPVGQRAIAGENAKGEAGYAHVVQCSTGAEGPGMAVDIGWSKDPNAKWSWPGGPVSGIIVPDRLQKIRLVAASSPPGLQPSAVPTIDSAVQVTPAGHRGYALQWFAFAAIAALIYGLALRKRLRASD